MNEPVLSRNTGGTIINAYVFCTECDEHNNFISPGRTITLNCCGQEISLISSDSNESQEQEQSSSQ